MSDIGDQELALLRAAVATSAASPVATEMAVAEALAAGGKPWDPHPVRIMLDGLVERGYLAPAAAGPSASTPAGEEPGYTITDAGRAAAENRA